MYIFSSFSLHIFYKTYSNKNVKVRCEFWCVCDVVVLLFFFSLWRKASIVALMHHNLLAVWLRTDK